mmetsp:Transcript_26168/g.64327  ORF Transcript_26168/g.64327 Transcript_26168/m.64327 type:complete len:124 (-) Transcript_26168:35-406(-)
MVKDIRVTYRKRHSYNTRSNKIRVVKTPGGRHVAHYVAKKAKPAVCGTTGKPLAGVARVRPAVNSRLNPHRRTVSRAYGGVLSAQAVKERIMRAFIIEEQRSVKATLRAKAAAAKAKAKSTRR